MTGRLRRVPCRCRPRLLHGPHFTIAFIQEPVGAEDATDNPRHPPPSPCPSRSTHTHKSPNRVRYENEHHRLRNHQRPPRPRLRYRLRHPQQRQLHQRHRDHRDTQPGPARRRQPGPSRQGIHLARDPHHVRQESHRGHVHHRMVTAQRLQRRSPVPRLTLCQQLHIRTHR